MYSVSKWCKPSHYSKHIFNWSSFQVLFTVFHSSVLILLKKKRKNNVAIQRNIVFCGPALRFASFYMRTVQSRTCTKVTRVGSATDTKPGRSEFIFRPVTCKCMKSSSSSRSYVITPKQSPSMIPFALLQKGSSNFWVCKWNLVLTFDSVNEI